LRWLARRRTGVTGAAAAVDLARSLVAVDRALGETGKSDAALAAYERARSAVAASDGSQPAGAAARSAFTHAGYRAGAIQLMQRHVIADFAPLKTPP
jgi:hypothetical protein